jgi:hypothetical protein
LLGSLVFGLLAALTQSGPALAATAPTLGAASSFAVLGATPDVNNTGPTLVTGDLGVSPAAAVIGFPPGIVTGTIHAADAAAADAQSANTTAYGALAGQACNTTFPAPTDLAGMTLVPGVYCFASSASNTGLLKLDALGNPDSVWVFKTVSTLVTGSGSSVVLVNGGNDCNVFWQVGSSATLGTTTMFVGNILALTSITMGTGATLSGRALAQTGTVTLDSSTISVCTVSQPPPTGTPSLGKSFGPATVNAGVVSKLTITLSNPNTSVATLTAPLVDTLPTGVVIAATPNASTTCSGSGAVAATAGGSTVTLPANRSIPAGSGSTPGTCTLTVDVTVATGGSYINTLAAGALMTSRGTNAAPAIATLTAVPLVSDSPPLLGKAFSPATVNARGVSTLTITLSNPNTSIATLTVPLVDTLPTGVVIAAAPNASTTCSGSGTVVATAGGSTVTLPATRSIPAGSGGTPGTCTATVNVTAAAGGSYINSLATDALVTSNGTNASPAVATLTVVPLVPVVPPPTAVPTLSERAMVVLAVLLALFGVAWIRRRAK